MLSPSSWTEWAHPRPASTAAKSACQWNRLITGKSEVHHHHHQTEFLGHMRYVPPMFRWLRKLCPRACPLAPFPLLVRRGPDGYRHHRLGLVHRAATDTGTREGWRHSRPHGRFAPASPHHESGHTRADWDRFPQDRAPVACDVAVFLSRD
jgi:hypothetical protein